MKLIWLACCCMLTGVLVAQQTLQKNYPLSGAKKIQLNFDYPKIVKVTTWDRNEVELTASVSINDGENNDAFILEESREDGALRISNKIKDMDKLPRRWILREKGSTEKMVFKTKEAFETFKKDKGNQGWDYWGSTTEIEITITLKVPAGMETIVDAKYGLVEVSQFNGPLQVTAPYGGIDASIAMQKIGKLNVTTRYGQIYSDLKLNITDSTEKDFYTSITASSGTGPDYKLNSTYGNLYLRSKKE